MAGGSQPTVVVVMLVDIQFFSIQAFISWSRYWSFRYGDDPLCAKGCDEYRSENASNARSNLSLLLPTFHGLNTVEKGVAYISHILSRNSTESGD